MPFQLLDPSVIQALDASPPLSLSPNLSSRAAHLLNTLAEFYGLQRTTRHGYKPAILIQTTFQNVASKDAFLMFFFVYIYGFLFPGTAISIGPDSVGALGLFFDDFESWDVQRRTDLKNAIEDFAENLVANFLLPIKASSGKIPATRQPTTELSSSLDTPQTILALRQACFERDHYRCVVSRKFDKKEAEKRFDQQGVDCTDDDGQPLKNESHGRFAYLEISHILPSRMRAVAPRDSEISESKKHVLRMLNMFDPGVVDLLDVEKIHSPLNALTLTHRLHRLFSDFQICFKPTETPHQYTIESIPRYGCLRESSLPVTRALFFSPSIDLPSPRLLAIHHAIALIIQLSGVAGYLDAILQGLEAVGVKQDGSTHLGHLTSLLFGGW